MITSVARDSKGQIMWIRGRTDVSPLTYKEFREGSDMKSGSVTKISTGQTFIPPFTVSKEDFE